MRRISSASSSAPRSMKTRVSPSFLHRSWAGVRSKTDGKSSGTTITGSLATSISARVGEGRLRGGDAGAGFALVAQVAERQLEGRQRRQHVLRAGGDPHRADTQRARPHLVEPGTDQDPV